MERILPKIKGLGSAGNPANRFERIEYIPADVGNEAKDAPKTVFIRTTLEPLSHIMTAQM